ncbi:MAG: hypothetical protein JXR86_15415 [Spirochaetales bacterium]|nr:hypothetical protein [Spirochaetales bacterium]
MNPALRGILWFFLASLILMFIFSFSGEDFSEAPLPGKINVVLLPLLFFLGSFYKYTLVFDKSSETISVYSGLLFFYRKRDYSFGDLNSVVKRYIKIRNPRSGGDEAKYTAFSRDRIIFGFVIDGKMILIDRNGRPNRMEELYMSFKAFFPYSVKEETE